MRKIKCNNCGKNLTKEPKYVFSYFSEPIDKYRNVEKQVLFRFCDDCGYEFYRSLGKNPNLNSIIGKGWSDMQKQIFKKDQQKPEQNRKYKELKVEVIKSFDENGEPYNFEKSRLIKTKRCLLAEKLGKIMKFINWDISYYGQHRIYWFYNEGQKYAIDVDCVTQSLEIMNLLYDICMDLGHPIPLYEINENLVYGQSESSYVLDKYERLFKMLQTVKNHYVGKMSEELKDSEYKDKIIFILETIHKALAGVFTTNDALIIMTEINYIDSPNVKKIN